jgi:hypothetical protein
MLIKKRHFKIIFAILIALFYIKIVFAQCMADQEGTLPGGPECKNIFQQAFASTDGITNAQISNPVKLDNDITLETDSPITIKDGRLTATITKDGVKRQVTNAKISSDGSIIEEASKVSDSNMEISNVQNARITRDETSIDSTTYATITPSSASGTTTLVNAKGVKSTRTSLRVVHADSISVGDATFTNKRFL